MAVNPDFRDLLSALCAADARFIVVGAHAVIYFSSPRYTKDLDLWVEPTRENAERVLAALARFGAPVEQLTVEDLAVPGTILQIGVEPNRIDLSTDVDGLDFAGAWRRRVLSTYGGVPVSILCLDDLVVNKRAMGRAQDLLDLDNLERARQAREGS
jgi:hypothetical protein